MVPLDLDLLGAAFTTGNAHKWLCAPKGAAFLHVRRDLQPAVHPTAISHGWSGEPGSRFREEFDWTGTADPTPFLAVPAALAFLASLVPGGWREVMERNHALALEARRILLEAVGGTPPAPASMVGSTASVPLPEAAPGSPAATLGHAALSNWFRERGVETWLYPWPCAGKMLLRVSAQLYNTREEYVRLAALLGEALG